MDDTNDKPTPPDTLSTELIQRIDTLELPELSELLSYVEERIDSLRTPIEAAIEANAAGKVIEIEGHRAYALVRMHPPTPDGTGVNTDITSLYHVRHEEHVDGSESLHWAYLGDVHNPAEGRCDTCGRTIDEDAPVCPYCENDNGDHAEREE